MSDEKTLAEAIRAAANDNPPKTVYVKFTDSEEPYYYHPRQSRAPANSPDDAILLTPDNMFGLWRAGELAHYRFVDKERVMRTVTGMIRSVDKNFEEYTNKAISARVSFDKPDGQVELAELFIGEMTEPPFVELAKGNHVEMSKDMQIDMLRKRSETAEAKLAALEKKLYEIKYILVDSAE